jgi:hypothetical protein
MNQQLLTTGKLAVTDIRGHRNAPSAFPEQNSAHLFYQE